MGIVSERCFALELILLRLAANSRRPSVGRCYWRRLDSAAVTDPKRFCLQAWMQRGDEEDDAISTFVK